MRISLTGAAGIGKTTLAKQLSEKLDLPVLEEDFAEIVETLNPASRDGKGQDRVRNYKNACLKWLKKRESLYTSHEDFIEDRCAIDVLFRWLLVNTQQMDNNETQRIINITKSFLDRTDFLILLPLTVTEEQTNESGLSRVGSTSILFRAQSLAIGIALQLVETSKIIFVPARCKTVEERLDFVLGRLK